MKQRQRRMLTVVVLVLGVGLAVGFMLKAFRQNLVYFVGPTEVLAGEAPKGRDFRLGGMVKEGSVQRDTESVRMRFAVTDRVNEIPVVYDQIPPDLFSEGRGVVAIGHMGPDGVFVAKKVLAKHDEEYMPKEVAKAIERAKKLDAQRGGRR